MNLGVDMDECPFKGMSVWTLKENKSVTICDCIPGNLYLPNLAECHEAYKRGFCEEGELLMPPIGENEDSLCQVNPCNDDGSVMYEKNCTQLGSECGDGGPSELIVNTDTFELDCVSTVYTIAFIDVPLVRESGCPKKGSKRGSQKICNRLV